MIPTAEEWLKNKYDVQSSSEVALGGKALTDKMIEFARLHCMEQAKAILKNMQMEDEDLEFSLSSYPLENIK